MHTSRLRFGLVLAASLLLSADAASQVSTSDPDSDGDGLSDRLEDSLLQTFRPTLMVSGDDCSALPARFTPGVAVPTVLRDDGTLYGQAFPRQHQPGEPPQIELHYYHLWRRDCGRMGHPLDAEHVAALLQGTPGGDLTNASAWTAVYWYAAAHEDTLCDASQLTRATTLHATTQGATVWISSGKHASFLSEELCHHGCGSDSCVQSRAVPVLPVINLGEAAHPMNGALWIASGQWPLHGKLVRSDFRKDRSARMAELPSSDILWANPAKRPAQAAIQGGTVSIEGTERGEQATSDAVATGSRSTHAALRITGRTVLTVLGSMVYSVTHALRRTLHTIPYAFHH